MISSLTPGVVDQSPLLPVTSSGPVRPPRTNWSKLSGGGIGAPGRVTFLPYRDKFGELVISNIQIRGISTADSACALHAVICYVDERDLTKYNDPQPNSYIVSNGINAINGAVAQIGGGGSAMLLGDLPAGATDVSVDIPGGGLFPMIAGVEWLASEIWVDGETMQVSNAVPLINGQLPWQASTAYAVGALVYDLQYHLQRCTQAGTSGAGTPGWNDSGGVTTDNTVKWQDQGLGILTGYRLKNLARTASVDHPAGSLAFGVTNYPVYQYEIDWVDELGSVHRSCPGAPEGQAFFGSWRGGTGDQFTCRVHTADAYPIQADIAQFPAPSAPPGYLAGGSVLAPDLVVPLPNACVVGVLVCASNSGGTGPWTGYACSGYDNYYSNAFDSGNILPVLPGNRTFDGSEYKFPAYQGYVYTGLVMFGPPWNVSNASSMRSVFCYSTEAPDDRKAQHNFECHLDIELLDALDIWRAIAFMQYWVDPTGVSQKDSWHWPDFSNPGAAGQFYPPPGIYKNQYPDHPESPRKNWPPWIEDEPFYPNESPLQPPFPGIVPDARMRWIVTNNGGKNFATILKQPMDVYTSTVIVREITVTDPDDGVARTMRVGDYLQIDDEIMLIYWIDPSTLPYPTVTVYRAVGQTTNPANSTPAPHLLGATVTDITAGAPKDLSVMMQV